jgi:D-alanyl-D-alanine carboxypeptidase
MKRAFLRFVDALRRRRLSGYGAYAGTLTHVYAISTIDDFDSVLSPYFKPNEPGATIIVTKDGKTLFRKAYGMADLERNIVLKPEMVLRLGSMTKQFTAAAIMLLSDEGKLAVTDDITKFLPGYPTQEKTITIENLLTHTSGIKNYTATPNFSESIEKDMTVQQVIDSFKNEPLDFEPGTGFSYSNSGYFLLGAIIEQVSGMSYASFMAQRIFGPLGMTQTAYEGHERNGSKRAEGYSGKNKARSISMTQPYAAGALVSTVDDLAIWDAAITSGTLLKSDTWKQVFVCHKLRNGREMFYAYGWVIIRFKGRVTNEHGGGINGFSTHAMRLPDDKIYVAVLMNNDGGAKWYHALAFLLSGKSPRSLAGKAAAIAIGKKKSRRSELAA